MKLKVFAPFATLLTTLCMVWALFAAQAPAQELKPVLTIKLADAKTLVASAEKIAELAGLSEALDELIGEYKSLKGINSDNPIWFIFQSDGEELQSPILYLPISDLDAVEIPGLDMIRGGLQEDGDGNYSLNTPFGLFDVVKKTGAYLISQRGTKIPGDPNKLIAGLEKYTLGIKVDFANTSLDSIQNYLAPFQMIVAMQNPDAADSLEQLNDALEQAHENFDSVTFGFVLDPKSADLEFDGVATAKKGSKGEKQIADIQKAKTIFDGFRMQGNNVVFSFGSVDLIDQDDVEKIRGQLETFLDGLLEQAEENTETDADFEMAETAAEAIMKIFDATVKQDQSDCAASLDSNGLFLGAGCIGDTAAFNELGELLCDKIKDKVGDEKTEAFRKKYFKDDYTDIEGFKLSSLIFPIEEIAKPAGCPIDLGDMTVALFQAVKENKAIAFACGLDAAKTQKALADALAKTKTPVAVQAPQFVFALKPFGDLLDRIAKGQLEGAPAEGVKILKAADSDARVIGTVEYAGNTVTSRFNVDGKALAAIIEVIKVCVAEFDRSPSPALKRGGIQNF